MPAGWFNLDILLGVKRRSCQKIKTILKSVKINCVIKSVKMIFSRIIKDSWRWMIKMPKMTGYKSELIKLKRILKVCKHNRLKFKQVLEILLRVSRKPKTFWSIKWPLTINGRESINSAKSKRWTSSIGIWRWITKGKWSRNHKTATTLKEISMKVVRAWKKLIMTHAQTI